MPRSKFVGKYFRTCETFETHESLIVEGSCGRVLEKVGSDSYLVRLSGITGVADVIWSTKAFMVGRAVFHDTASELRKALAVWKTA